jgi:glycosyltransferase involved in cell wall biosynthesis
MRLAYVVKRFPKFSETFILREVEELIRQGDDVVLYSLTRPYAGEPRHDGVDAVIARTCYLPTGTRRVVVLVGSAVAEVVRSRRTAWDALVWCAGWSLRHRRLDHVRRFGEACYVRRRLPADVDHVHAHFAHGPTTVALLLARLAGLPFSFTGHAKDIFELVPPQLLRAKVAEATFVAAVSDYTREQIAAAVAPRDREKIVVVRNGVDRTRFSGNGRAPESPPLILAVSRLVEKKGLDTLVEACSLLRRRGVDFRCELIGEGPQRSRLEQQVNELGISDRVVLVGSRDHAAVHAAYERATLFALPSRRVSTGDQDGLPVAIVEALAAGVPVVTTPTSGIPEVVEGERSGLLVPSNDPAALADALERLLRDSDLHQRLASGGRARAADYDLTRCVARLRGLFANGHGGC